MDWHRRSRRSIALYLGYLSLGAAVILSGCASPAPPQAPSLKLPQPVRDLTAQRIGNTVELRFTPPAKSTDKLALRGPTLSGQLCRQLPRQPCVPVGPRTSIPLPNSNDPHDLATWTDTLPTSLTQGPIQLLTYRVEFFSPAGRSAGQSNQAFTASGPAPAAVENFHAEGSRLGIILQWTPAPGEVILRRENLAPIGHTPPIVWLQTNDSNGSQPHTLDTAVLPNTPYLYVAQRRSTLHLANRTIELNSAFSTPLHYSLQEVYPPPAPSGLTSAAYTAGTPPTFAVDLIWQPVNQAGLVTPLAGYNLYREQLSASGGPTSHRIQLNSSPIQQPSFHDSTANPSSAYRYSVTAIDTKGNQSSATTVLLPSSHTP